MITATQLEAVLDMGLSRKEMLSYFGCCSKTVTSTIRLYGPALANARRDVGLKKRIIREYDETKLPYRMIANRCDCGMQVVAAVLSEYRRVVNAGKSMPVKPPVSEVFNWGDTLYRGSKVTVLREYDGTTQIMFQGSPTWVPSCEVRTV